LASCNLIDIIGFLRRPKLRENTVSNSEKNEGIVKSTVGGRLNISSEQ